LPCTKHAVVCGGRGRGQGDDRSSGRFESLTEAGRQETTRARRTSSTSLPPRPRPRPPVVTSPTNHDDATTTHVAIAGGFQTTITRFFLLFPGRRLLAIDHRLYLNIRDLLPSLALVVWFYLFLTTTCSFLSLLAYVVAFASPPPPRPSPFGSSQSHARTHLRAPASLLDLPPR
jgi:hypothetical protein